MITRKRWVVLMMVLAIVLCLSVFGTAFGATRNVPADYATIQAAIDAAFNGDVIVVAPGAYYELINFSGKDVTVRSTAPNDPSVVEATVIDGLGSGTIVTFEGGETAAAVLNGLTICNGGLGKGGVYCSASSPTLSNNIIKNNSPGGVRCALGSSPILTNNIITGNTGASAVYCVAGSCPILTNNTITCNRGGAGIGCVSSAPVVTSNIISENRNGGGVRCISGSSVTISSNTITGNGGMGVYCDSSSPTIDRNIICENAGGVYCTSSAPSITNNSICYNSGGSAGGVYCTSSSPGITNNIICGNSGQYAGGVYCYSSSPILTNNAICNNVSSYYGGGMYCGNSSSPAITANTIAGNGIRYGSGAGGGIYCTLSSSPTITNTIIAFSTNGGGLQRTDLRSVPAITYCNFYGNIGGDFVNFADPTGANGNISMDPRFVNAEGGDYRLKSQAGHWSGTAWVKDLVTSPCIDAGNPASAFANEPTPNGGRVNMGYDGNTAYASKTWVNQLPTAPTQITVVPGSPNTTDDLTATATGSFDPDPESISYHYQWAQSTDAGATWSDWGNAGATVAKSLTTRGQLWRVRARAADAVGYSAWFEAAPVEIVNAPPTAPDTITVAPTTALIEDDLVATATGGSDADGDTLSIQYEWARSTDGGSTWDPYGNAGATLSNTLTAFGESWRARARTSDGTATSAWVESSIVTVGVRIAPTLASVQYVDPTHLDLLFSKPMDAVTTAVAGNYAITPALTVSAAALDADTTTVHLTTAAQQEKTDYTVAVSGVQDAVGTAIVSGADATRTWTTPGVPPTAVRARFVSATRVDVLFNKDMDAATADVAANYQLNKNLTVTAATLSADSRTVHLTTTAQQGATTYTVTVSGVCDALGTAVVAGSGDTASWTSVAAPAVRVCTPRSTGIPVGANIYCRFTTPMKQASVHNNFYINGQKVTEAMGTFIWVGTKCTFNPAQNLQPNRRYQVKIARAAVSKAGIRMAAEKIWNFTTAPAAAPAMAVSSTSTASGAQVTVNLSAAADVTIAIRNLAGREITVLRPGQLPAGVHSLLWNGKSSSGTTAPGGVYLVQVSARVGSGAGCVAMTSLRR